MKEASRHALKLPTTARDGAVVTATLPGRSAQPVEVARLSAEYLQLVEVVVFVRTPLGDKVTQLDATLRGTEHSSASAASA